MNIQKLYHRGVWKRPRSSDSLWCSHLYLSQSSIYTVPNLVVEELPFGRALKKSWSMTKEAFRLLWRILSLEFLLTFLGFIDLGFTLTVDKRDQLYFWVETIFLVLIRTFYLFYSLDKGGSLGIILDSAWEVPSRSVMRSKAVDEGSSLLWQVIFLMVQSGSQPLNWQP